MTASTLTLTDLKIMVGDRLDLDANKDLDDITVVIGVNNYLKSYVPEEQKAFPSRSRKEVSVAIGSAGYDLSLITDLGDTNTIKVYDTTVEKYNRRFVVREGDGRVGYYIKDGTLYLAPEPDTSDTFIIVYMPKITQYSISTLPDFDTTVLPIMLGAETGAELMVSSRYMEQDQSDPQRAVNYKNDALAEISNFFATHTGVATYSPY